MSADDGHKFYFSGEEDRHEYGVRFLVHSECCFSMPTSLQQTDINPPGSSSFQHHHQIGLSQTSSHDDILPATPGNHRSNTKERYSGCIRGLECLSWEGCTGRPGRRLWTLLQCRDK